MPSLPEPRCCSLSFLPFLAICVAVLWAQPARSQTQALGDLFSEEVLYQDSNPRHFARLGSWTLFSARTERYGTELWRTDGSEAGTTLVRDINPGKVSSIPEDLTTLGDLVYFRARTRDYGTELWQSDGTAEGTVRVADIAPGRDSSDPEELTAVGSTLFFTADDGVHGRELWKVGAVGVSLVKDLWPGETGSEPQDLMAMDSLLAFSASTPDSGRDLAISDGFADGTKIFDLVPTASSFASVLGVFEDSLIYLRALTPEHGIELWAFLVPTQTYRRLTDGVSGSGSSLPRHPWMRGDDLVFSMFTDSGRAIYESIDGRPATELTSAPGPLDQLYGLGSEILFVMNGDLWTTDNSPSGSSKLASPDIQGAGFPIQIYLFEHQNEVYFFGDGGLWKTDGSVSGTNLEVPCDCDLDWTQPVAGQVFFSIDDEDGNAGQEPWWLQGTLQQIADVHRSLGNSEPSAFTVAGERLYFPAFGDGIGRELYQWDGVTGTASSVEDLEPGTLGSFPIDLMAAGSRLYFRAAGSGFNLMRLEDPLAGSAPVGDHIGQPIGALDGQLYTRQVTSSTQQLYKIDDLSEIQVSNFGSSDAGVQLDPPAVLGDHLYFVVDTLGFGEELWRSDGETVGLVDDIAPGTASSSPSNLYAHQGALYFEAKIFGTTFRGLRKTDGSPAGTQTLSTVSAQAFSSLGNDLIFAGFDETRGQELWKSDGTVESTAIIADLQPGSENGLPSAQSLATTSSLVFFQGYQSHLGDELWVSDGTSANTRLLRDIVPGVESSGPREFVVLPNDEVVFTAFTPTHGWELWRSNGTTLGTYRVSDIFPGPASAEPVDLTLFGDWVVFSADSGNDGREPWAYNWSNQPLIFTDGFESGNPSAWATAR